MDNKKSADKSQKDMSWLWRFTTYILVLAQIPAFWLFLIQPMLKGEFFAFTEKGRTAISDFVHFYAAGAMAQSADRLAVYDPSVQLKWLNHLIAPVHCNTLFYMQYVPFIFPALIPLAKLSMLAAFWMWVLVSLTLGAIALYVILHDVRKISGQYIPFIILLIVSSMPSYITLYLGQTSWLMLSFFCLYFANWLKKRDFTAGICLALTSIKPQYALFLAMPALANKRWRLLATAALAEAAFLLAAVATIGPANVFNYPHILWLGETNPTYWGVNANTMISVRAPLSLLFTAPLALNLSTICMLSACAFTFVLWLYALKKDLTASYWAMALTIVLCLTFSAHTHAYDSLLLALSACLTVGLTKMDQAQADNGKQARMKKTCLYVWSILLITYALICALLTNPKVLATFNGLPLFSINLLLAVSGLTYFFLQYGATDKDTLGTEGQE